jgi:hypothetical protein
MHLFYRGEWAGWADAAIKEEEAEAGMEIMKRELMDPRTKP